jgi:hypothetical protein
MIIGNAIDEISALLHKNYEFFIYAVDKTFIENYHDAINYVLNETRASLAFGEAPEALKIDLSRLEKNFEQNHHFILKRKIK